MSAKTDKEPFVVRKIAALEAEEFFDFALAISPILPLILDLESVRMQLYGAVGEGMAEARAQLLSERMKKKPDNTAINKAVNDINREAAHMLKRDVLALTPKLISREGRDFIYEGLAILTRRKVSEVKKVKGAALVNMLRRVIADIDIKDFLDFTDAPEQTE